MYTDVLVQRCLGVQYYKSAHGCASTALNTGELTSQLPWMCLYSTERGGTLTSVHMDVLVQECTQVCSYCNAHECASIAVNMDTLEQQYRQTYQYVSTRGSVIMYGVALRVQWIYS